MCGLAAIFSVAPQIDLPVHLSRLIDRASHRGPDGRSQRTGSHQDPCDSPHDPAIWGMAHVRLAILDLTDAGLQPMPDARRRRWVVYNGEIYNYLELAAELRKCGFTFRTGTDTEVLLAAYSRWGRRCVEHLVGMFAFVLVDLDHGRVLLGRDRLGVKPLYVWQDRNRLVVVSEPKQLLALQEFQPRAHRQQLSDFLVDSVLAHEPDVCLFDQVQPLPPAHTWCWTLGELPAAANLHCYWSPSTTLRSISWQEAVESTRDLFADAVRLRLRSDVPVGTCLSGGLDSSSIVGVASRWLHARLDTFSFIDHGTPRDESPYVEAVNRHCGTTSHQVGPDPDAAAAEFAELIYYQDEPVRQMAQYAEYCVMRLARQHNVKVLLNGQGGDESLCGYRKFVYFYLKQLVRNGHWAHASRHLLESGLRGDRQLLQLHQGLRYAPSWLRQRADPLVGWLRPAFRKLVRHVWRERMQGMHRLHDHQWADLRYWSLPVLLRYQDRNSMAHGIETRLPLVDHRFLEHTLTLPESYFFRHGMTKRLLVEAMGDALPQQVRQRRTKLGFDSPQADWLCGPLGEVLQQRIQRSDRLNEILDSSRVAAALQEYRQRGPSTDHWWLFRVGSLATWLDVFQVEP